MKFFLTSMFGKETSRGDRRFGLDRMVFLLSLFILVVTVLMPMVMIIVRTFFKDGAPDWEMFVRVVLEPENLSAVWNTIKIGFLVTVFGTVLGLFYAWLIGRSDIPMKGFMKALFTIPYMFPPFFGAMAWSLMLAPRSGYFNKWFMSLTGGTTPLLDINSIGGIVFVETCRLWS